MPEEPSRCRGMRDLLPADMARFRQVEEAFRSMCLAWGYQEVRTPTIEHLHLFTAAGTLSPRMLGRVYSFLDWDGWSGERVVLRPEATIPAARLFVEHLREEKLAKLFYTQNVFRFAEGDEPREGWQCGVELMGDTQPRGDLELILLGWRVLEELRLTPVEVRLSHPGIVRSVLARAGLASAEQVRIYDRILDGDLSVLAEVEERLPSLQAPLRILFEGEGSSAYLSNLRNTFAAAVPGIKKPLDELTVVADALTALGCPCQIATALVRNFEYYSGPVFQFSARGRVVGSGGRYDGLVALVGGPRVPASGFALDAGRLAGLLPAAEQRVASGEMVEVRPASEKAEALAAAFEAAERVRHTGLSAEVVLADGQPAPFRWELTVDSSPEGMAYSLHDHTKDVRQTYRSLDELVGALEAMAGAP
jgi:histidyl-tRNA synthetase